MRSILRDFSEEFFKILSFPKEEWFSFWLEHRKDHPRLWEEYLMKNCMNERDVEKELQKVERRELDSLHQSWLLLESNAKSSVLKSLKNLSSVLELSREDFVVFIMVALGKSESIIVPTSKGHVIMIDLLSLYRKGKLNFAGNFIIEKMREFRAYSEYMVSKDDSEEEKGRKFERIFELIQSAINKPSGEEALQEIVRILDHYVEYYNWTGFYITSPGEQLELGPFVGEPTEHVKIKFGQGICGQAAKLKEVFVVPDVDKEDNYLSCSDKTKSEIVVPIIDDDRILGEIDIDSHHLNAFSAADEKFLEKISELVVKSKLLSDQ
ncbi:histidine kinase [Kosmotoga arenicorallina S304]|uniref:Histidine kinase n=1 Tax=Kosmotoga arenicorallina S304 TaxID=1453497 RepID=A0A182C6Y5_9BACT|nr:GAF domain-containing protein [Kosmotoga arenicorallina]OAA31215.1 histidine kinase [Kosmotoga arenicorallina S304]